MYIHMHIFVCIFMHKHMFANIHMHVYMLNTTTDICVHIYIFFVTACNLNLLQFTRDNYDVAGWRSGSACAANTSKQNGSYVG